MINNELFWYKQKAFLKFRYERYDYDVDTWRTWLGGDVSKPPPMIDTDSSGVGNTNYDRDASGGAVDADIAAQVNALRAAEEARRRAEDAARVQARREAESAERQKKLAQAKKEYYDVANPNYGEMGSWGTPGSDKGGAESINIAGIVSAAGRVGSLMELGEKGIQALGTLKDALSSGISEIVKDAIEVGKDPVIDAVVEAAKILQPIISSGDKDKPTTDSPVVSTDNPSYDPSKKYIEEARKKEYDQAVKDLEKSLDALAKAEAEAALAAREAELAEQKAKDAEKTLLEILEGIARDNENPEIAEIADGLTKEDAEKKPVFVDSGGAYWINEKVPYYDIGYYMNEEQIVSHYHFPNEVTVGMYIYLSKVTKVLITDD